MTLTDIFADAELTKQLFPTTAELKDYINKHPHELNPEEPLLATAAISFNPYGFRLLLETVYETTGGVFSKDTKLNWNALVKGKTLLLNYLLEVFICNIDLEKQHNNYLECIKHLWEFHNKCSNSTEHVDNKQMLNINREFLAMTKEETSDKLTTVLYIFPEGTDLIKATINSPEVLAEMPKASKATINWLERNEFIFEISPTGEVAVPDPEES